MVEGWEELEEISQTVGDRVFGLEDLDSGCGSGIYEEVSFNHARKAMLNGYIIYSAFTVWKEGSGGRKDRLVMNLSKQSKHCKHGSVNLDNLSEFASYVREGD